MAAYRDTYKIRGGKITLYRRVGSVSTKDGVYRQSDKWHAAIRVTGYKTIRRSLKTENQEDAEIAAEDLYQELLFKTKKGLSLKTRRFGLICEGYLRHIQSQANLEKKLPVKERSHSLHQLKRSEKVARTFINSISRAKKHRRYQ